MLFVTIAVTFVDGGSQMSAASTTGLSQSEMLSDTESVTKPSEMEDSFFSAWLSSPSQQQEARQSPSSRSPLSPKQQSAKHTLSTSLKESRSISSTPSSGTALSRERASRSEEKLRRVSSSEESAVGLIKSDQKEAAYSQLQPISVSISDDRQAKAQKTDVAGLLISASVGEIARTSSSDRSDRNLDEDLPVDKGTISDVRNNDVPEADVAVLVSSSNEDGTDESRVDHRDVLSVEPQLDTSSSSGYLNSQLSSSILSPNPDELSGVDDILPESGWNDVVDSDMWMSSTVDLPEMESADISMADVRARLSDQLDDGDGDFQCATTSGVVDNVDQVSQLSDKDEVTFDISQDVSDVVSAEVDAKIVKQVPSLEGSMRETSSLEGSLETSADELSESNKTVVAEDSDLYCDDTDVDEMQTSGSARSVIQQEHSMPVLSSELCSSSADGRETAGNEPGLPSVTGCQLAELPATHGDDGSEASSPPSSGCVKNMLEEAMADGSARDSSGSVEPARIESGGNSGHTSADEIDTTTSSDIEIISHTSSMNGRTAGTHGSRPVDISPTRHSNVWNSRTPYSVLSSGQHRRSDSGSSAQSLQSRTDDDFASPEADHGRDYQNRPSRDSRRHFAKSDSG